jgi:hypothetical protein
MHYKLPRSSSCSFLCTTKLVPVTLSRVLGIHVDAKRWRCLSECVVGRPVHFVQGLESCGSRRYLKCVLSIIETAFINPLTVTRATKYDVGEQ